MEEWNWIAWSSWKGEVRSSQPFAGQKGWEHDPGNNHNGNMVVGNHSSRGKRGIDGVLGFENAGNHLRESRESKTGRYGLGVS